MPVPLSSWVCTPAPGKSIRIEDIPGDRWAEITRQQDMSWLEIMSRPFLNWDVGMAVYRICCAELGVEPKTSLTGAEMYAMFEAVEDDRPMFYNDGLPDPKADEKTTVG